MRAKYSTITDRRSSSSSNRPDEILSAWFCRKCDNARIRPIDDGPTCACANSIEYGLCGVFCSLRDSSISSSFARCPSNRRRRDSSPSPRRQQRMDAAASHAGAALSSAREPSPSCMKSECAQHITEQHIPDSMQCRFGGRLECKVQADQRPFELDRPLDAADRASQTRPLAFGLQHDAVRAVSRASPARRPS